MNKKPFQDFLSFGNNLTKARQRCGLTQKELADACDLAQSDISKIEAGDRWSTPPQLAKFARQLGVSLQWFLTGNNRPGLELADIVLELRSLGVVDLFVPAAKVPGAFRPREQIVAWAVRGDQPDARIVEALPAVFAWNVWNADLLTAFGRAADPRGPSRLAWLVDVALTIHKAYGFPGGFIDPIPLTGFLRTKPWPKPDDLGRAASREEELPPVSRRWRIRYAADLEQFHKRAVHLFSLRQKEGDSLD